MIETTIQELTAAIRELTVALNNSRPVATRPVPSTSDNPVVVTYAAADAAAAGAALAAVAPAPKPAKAKAPKAEPAPAPTPEPEPLPTPEPLMAEESPVKVGKVTQADLRDAAAKLLAQKKLPEILRINREHGIRRITECPEEKYESVYNALNAALADGEKS